jgi:hypothetical protein
MINHARADKTIAFWSTVASRPAPDLLESYRHSPDGANRFRSILILHKSFVDFFAGNQRTKFAPRDEPIRDETRDLQEMMTLISVRRRREHVDSTAPMVRRAKSAV